MDLKQVIVVRKDLNMRKGKMIAQGSHASVRAAMISAGRYAPEKDRKYKAESLYHVWDEQGCKKIAVSVDSEKELLEIYEAAVKADFPVALITDAGHTEFHGVPTKTALAIGPGKSEDIDKITGKLKLL